MTPVTFLQARAFFLDLWWGSGALYWLTMLTHLWVMWRLLLLLSRVRRRRGGDQ